jgi:hypothetical protein
MSFFVILRCNVDRHRQFESRPVAYLRQRGELVKLLKQVNDKDHVATTSIAPNRESTPSSVHLERDNFGRNRKGIPKRRLT